MYNIIMPILLFLFIGEPLVRDAPKASVDRFYSIVLSSGNSGGFPSLSELDQLAPHMSKHLMKLFLDAKDCIIQFEKDHPPEPMPNGLPPVIYKPPFSGGSIFSSNAEGATSFRTGKSTKNGDKYRVDLHLTYVDATPGSNHKPFQWIDAVYVIKEENRFVIDDIEFLGTWPYGNHGLLSKMIEATINLVRNDKK
jgi:hypothetical protein